MIRVCQYCGGLLEYCEPHCCEDELMEKAFARVDFFGNNLTDQEVAEIKKKIEDHPDDIPF